MDVIQVLTLVGSIAALMFWFRSESRADHRQLQEGVNAQLNGMRAEMKEFRDMWMAESKDFHKHLCEIEASRKC